MADITISDLELAPALADDMVLAVENTTDTYAATLAMLRRLINKTFVEVENADFNALTDDGFYQCTGTPTNSPVAGAINWTLQVSAENGVVVQRAFSLDDSFANLYIRRWNGVTWTAWIEEGAGALTQKANVDLDNLSTEGQAILDNKVDLTSTQHISGQKYIKNPILAKDNELEGGQIFFEKSANDVCGVMLIDRFNSKMRFISYNENGDIRIPVKISFNGGGVFYGNYPPVNMNAGVSWSLPSSNIVVPGNGIFFLKGRNNNGTSSSIYINDKLWSWEWSASQYNFFRHIPVLIGDTLRMSLGGGTAEFELTFYPYI